MNAILQSPRPVGGDAATRLSDEDFLTIARLVRDDFGLNLQLNKKDMVVSRLGRRVKELGLPDFAAYVQRLSAQCDHDELRLLRSALTTNVTRFFREDHHFDLMRSTVLPALIAQARAGGRVRLWSAGCSSGQEPYSLALTLLDLCPDAASLDVFILATDIDPQVLNIAARGVYPAEEAGVIPVPMRRYLAPSRSFAESDFAMGDLPRALVRFAELNLMGDWPMRGPMDVIFCRNVVIYFDTETQAKLWERFARQLSPGGYLVMGHSERLIGPANACFERVANNVYRRIANIAVAEDCAL